VGGTIAHAEPSAELPAIAMLLDGRVRLTTVRDALEVSVVEYLADWARREATPHVVTALTLDPPKPSSAWGFTEISRGFGTGNTALCGVVLEHRSGWVRKASIVIGGANLPARRLADLEERLVGLRTSGSLPGDAIEQAVAGLVLADDPLRGSAAYLRSAVETVVRGALESARARMGEA
jgi:carbon-monoxide dehydrogenase medium subunit